MTELSLKKFDIESMLPNATILILGRRRSGKCLAKDQKVLMYNGDTKCIQDVIVGDYLVGDDNFPRKVLSTHSGTDFLYTIKTSTNDTYIVNSEHILSLYFKHSKTFKYIFSKNCIVITWFCNKTYKLIHNLFKLEDQHEAVEYFEKIKEDRYVDIPIKEYISLPHIIKSNLIGYKVLPTFGKKTFLKDAYLKGYMCIDTWLYIKKEYLYGSIKTRMSFLKGFLKRNASYVCKKAVIYSFKNVTNERILKDFLILLKTLCLTFYFTKKSLIINLNKNCYHMIDVKEHCVGKYYGVEIDGNQRFLLDNCVVTHNSWLVRDIFFHHKQIPLGIIFSGTEEANPFYGDFIPDAFIHSEYDANIIEKLLKNQSSKIKKAKEEGYLLTDGRKESNRAFIVLDDLLHQASVWNKEKTIKTIFFNGRHYNIFFILTMQYPLGIPPPLRTNIDYVFIFNDPSVKNRKKIYEDYAGMIPDFNQFCSILESCSKDHGCLVVKTSAESTKIEDQVFWYKADLRDKFRAGHKKMWEYHKDRYNKEYVTNVPNAQLVSASTKKLKITINKMGETVQIIDS